MLPPFPRANAMTAMRRWRDEAAKCAGWSRPLPWPVIGMGSLAGKFAVAVVLAALLTQPSYAQPFPESDRQKAAEARKKAEEKQTDEAYKSTMKHAPNADKKLDPWGGIRAPSPNSSK
jgi:hypothetical protein